jgi:hypothetical protein
MFRESENMNIRILLLAGLGSIFFLSCGSNKNISSEEERTLYSKIRKFEKDPGNTTLRQEIIDLYQISEQQHLERVEALKTSSDLTRFDKLIQEFEYRQKISDAIRSSHVYRYITPPNYHQQIVLLKEESAKAWCNDGQQYLNFGGRENARKAYLAFNKAVQYGSNNIYAREKMKEAYESATVDVVVRPVRFEDYFFSGRNNRFYAGQQVSRLVSDLGGSYASSVPARFYTEQEALSRRIDPNWIVELVWANLNINEPALSRQTRTVTKNIHIGADSAGRPLYKTVNANLHIKREFLQASGYLEYRITDLDNRNKESGQRIYAQYIHEDEYATYEGDSRALSPEDWSLINNRGKMNPDRNEILEEMYRNIYQDLKNRIRNEADW